MNNGTQSKKKVTLYERPPFIRQQPVSDDLPVYENQLSIWEKIYQKGWFRKGIILLVLACIWQAYAVYVNDELLFPTFIDTISAFFSNILNDDLLGKTSTSLKTLLMGYAVGLLCAAILTVIASMSLIGRDLLETLTSMFNPLPAIAILPLAMIWFGLGEISIIFVLVHSVLWAVALNTHSGFQSVSKTLRMVGRNYNLTGLSYVGKILIPAAFPNILTGFKIGWAFAWRTLIAAELVFGVSSGSGGLGWFIFEKKNQLEIASVFSGLLMVILVGLFVENFIFRVIENKTIHKWGMQN